MIDAPTRQALYIYNQWEKLAALPGLGALTGMVKKVTKPITESAWKGVKTVGKKAIKPAAITAGVGVPAYLGVKAMNAGKKPTSMQTSRSQRQTALRYGSPGVRSGSTGRQLSRVPTGVRQVSTTYRH